MDDSTEDIECPKCERSRPEEFFKTAVVGDDEYELCEMCRDDIEFRIENNYWYDTYTEEHHEKLIGVLEDTDEILCFSAGPHAAGDVIIHTNYVSSDVVTDICTHFGMEIRAYGPVWEDDNILDNGEPRWECVEEHGSCFQILLVPTDTVPLPIEAPFNRTDIEWLEESDKQFDAEF